MRDRARAGLLLLLCLAALSAEAAPAEPLDFQLAARPLGGLRGEVASLLLGGREGGAFLSAVVAVPAEPEGAFEVWAEIDGAGLLAAGGDDDPRLELYAYAINARGEVKGHFGLALDLELATHGAALFAGGLKLLGRLDPLPPGRYQLRVLLREARSQRFALRLVSLEVGAARPGPSLSPPLVAGLPEAWLLARPIGLELREREGSHPAERFPAALPVLAAGRSTSLLLLARGLRQAPASGGTLRFLDAAGLPKAEVGITPSGAAGEGPSGTRRLAFRATPPDLATGNYQLLAVLPGPGGPVESPAVRAYVLGRELPPEPIAWTALAHLAAGRRQAEAADAVAEGGEAGRLPRGRRIARAYRSALATLAAGDTAGAVEAVAILETEAFGSAHSGAADRLADAELEVASRVAGRDAEALAPLLLLHLELHDRYVAERSFALASHGRRIVSELARRFGREAGGELAPSLAAEALTALGLYLHGARLTKAGDAKLTEALELESEHRSALLYLALSHERYGRYREAVPLLRRLLALEPGRQEAALRLALCLGRLENGSEQAAGEAEALLRDLLRGNPAEWILTLAYQELARLLAGAGREGEALRLLREGVGRIPASARLALQWAAALEAAGERESAAHAVDLAASRQRPARATPRYRYNLARTLDPAAGRAPLARAALARLPNLVAALGEEGS